ncbi:hypothetical protein, partial [Streptomyces sp. NPDC002346]
MSRLSQWRTKLWHDMPRDLALNAPVFGDGQEMALLTDGYDGTSWRIRSPAALLGFPGRAAAGGPDRARR